MSGLIDQGYKTVSQYGFKVFTLRVYNYSMFKLKRVLLKNNVEEKKNNSKFKSIHNKYKGKRIFVIGNGPSLNKQALYLLKDEYKMCFNRFCLMEERLNWMPNFFAVTDDLVIKDMADGLNKDVVPRVEYAFFPDLHPSNVNVKNHINDRKNVMWLHVDKPDFSDHLPDCGINKTVVNAGIQIAAWMGFSEIYLLGVDMTFADQNVKKNNSRNWEAKGDDPNHFDPRYFGKGRKYHNPGVAEMLQKFEKCKEFFDVRGVKIYNAGYGGRLEAFPRVDFDSLFDLSDLKKEKMLLDAIHAVNPSIGLNDFVSGVDENVSFVCGEEGADLIKSYIMTHIPFGPYKGNYYFMKRG